MEKKLKIVVIGAGSASFGFSIIRDAFFTKELWGANLVLVDLNKETLLRTESAAKRINEELKAGYIIESTTNREEALQGAHYVIISIAIDRTPMWKLDFEIPKKHGVLHVLGENAGPGAVFHTLRNIPIIMSIARDIEKYCPDAMIINFTNPESRLCLLLNRYTKIKTVGLCHQINHGIKDMSKFMDIPVEDIDVKAYGINHFTWARSITHKKTKEDLYPLLRNKIENFKGDYEALTRHCFKTFGLYPMSGDGHLGEYFKYAHEFMDTNGYDFDKYELYRHQLDDYLTSLADKNIDLRQPFYSPHNNEVVSVFEPSGEDEFSVIKGIECNSNDWIVSANLPNNGAISNMPNDAIVEVPAFISANGINAMNMGDLPDSIAAMCKTQFEIHSLVVDAGYTGNKDLIMQALLLEPCVQSAKTAEKIYDELMPLNEKYLNKNFYSGKINV